MNNISNEDKDFSSDGSKNEDSNASEDIIALDLREALQNEQIVTSFTVNRKSRCIVVRLNHEYDKKTIVSSIYKNWLETIDSFSDRARKK